MANVHLTNIQLMADVYHVSAFVQHVTDPAVLSAAVARQTLLLAMVPVHQHHVLRGSTKTLMVVAIVQSVKDVTGFV